MQSKKLKNLYYIILIIFLLFSFQMFYFGIATFCDSLRGFEILKQFENGGKWNFLNYPSVQNTFFSYFVSWWSPGQWYFAFLVKKMGILNPQHIQYIIVMISTSASLYGYYKLFIYFKWEKIVVFISILFILTTHSFYIHFIEYSGGDLLLLAILPNLILAFINWSENKNLKNFIIVVFLCLISLFSKNTFVLVIFSLFIYIFFKELKNFDLLNLKTFILKNYILIFFVSLIIVIWYNYYINKGETPGTSIDNIGFWGLPKNKFAEFSYTFGSPMGIFSKTSYLLQILTKRFNLFYIYAHYFQILNVILTFLIFYTFRNKNIDNFRIILAFLIPIFIFFTILNWTNKAVGYEMRHFAPFTFITFPFFVNFLLTLKNNIGKISLILLIFLDIFWSILTVRFYNKNFEKINGFKIEKSEIKIYKQVEKYDKNNNMFIAEDIWSPLFLIENMQKIAIRKKTNFYEVISGMELDNPDINTNIYNFIPKNINKLFFLKYKKGNINIENDFNKTNFSKIYENYNFILYSKTTN